jgi:hypothetical protein
MIEFFAQMPTDTKIFLTMAVLGLATMLISAERADLGRATHNAQIALSIMAQTDPASA